MDVEVDLLEAKEELKSRPYQDQLEEKAIRKNTIIYLPTGSGKTFIAIRLISRLRKALQKPWGEGGKRTFFLVNTVPLVIQQKKVVEKLCPVKNVGSYSGEDYVDYWNKQKWDQELTKYQVIVMTCQILADMLQHGYIHIRDINLLIFDECHHAVDDHPMRLIMKHFEDCPSNEQPRVLGLTATLLNANVKINKVEETLRTLETTYHASIATVDEFGEVLSYSTNPYELLLHYSYPAPSNAAQEAKRTLLKLKTLVMAVKLPNSVSNPDVRLEAGQLDISKDPKKIVKCVGNMAAAMATYISDFGVFGGSLAISAHIILLERLRRKCLTVEEELFYKFVITYSLQAKLILEDSMKKEKGYEKIVKHSSEQVLILLKILKEYNPALINTPGVSFKVNRTRKSLSGIIFTRQRFTAQILYNFLKEVKQENPEEFGFLKHDFIVGFNINPFKCTREQHYIKKQGQNALLKFANQDLNCLISTSVIEEGVDIPQCSLVLLYDPPLEYRSYIQSKGRARSSESTYVIMVKNEDRNKFFSQYKGFQSTEGHIQKMLIGNTDERDMPTQDEIQKELYEDDEIEPYVTKFGRRLSAVSSISLLNRYCSVLPHDQFTVIAPMLVLEKKFGNKLAKIQSSDSGKVQVIIFLPIACPVKEAIKGQPMNNLKDAKRSAALNACIKLHEAGELDEYTLLPKEYGKVDFEQPDIRMCFPNWPWDAMESGDPSEREDLAKPGTKKRMRKHKKVFPMLLKDFDTWDKGHKVYYLHLIQLETTFKMPEESREKALYTLLQCEEGFGLLTPNPLPKLCSFPLFLTVGEVRTSLRSNYASIQLNKELFEIVKSFHHFIFDQVIQIAKKFLTFEGKENCLYVVPVKPEVGYEIDWDVMRAHKEIRPVLETSFEERKSLRVTPELYRYSVVTPWYRGFADRYIVSNVLEYMTTQSRFGSDAFTTFEDYYDKKYNLQIVGKKDQPLLEVRNISTRMNCLLPRAKTIKEFSEKQQKLISLAEGDDPHKGFDEIFIPEYCIRYDFPGVLWYKAYMLPSIVHRVNMLLVAYELRAQIGKDTGYGTNLPKEEEWLPIEANIQVAMKALLSQVEGPAAINSIDRINNPLDENAPKPPNTATMKETAYHLMKKRINKEYPWEEKSEPIDIVRNITSVTVMDIECYDEFVTAKIATKVDETFVKSPPIKPVLQTALLPPPMRYNDKIQLIQKQLTGRGPELRDMLAALTTIKSNDNFNLERVETLGDSFLKFAASLYLYHKFPTLNEGQLTNIKCRLIGNRNLYYAGEKFNLAGRMKIEHFSPKKDFLVPGFFAPERVKRFIEDQRIRPSFLIGMCFPTEEALAGEISDESWARVQQRYNECDGAAEPEPLDGAINAMQCYIKAQAVADKSVADCVEALIGTYLLSGGILAAIKIIEWMKVLPPEDNFARMLHKPVSTALTENRATEHEINFIMDYFRSDVETILNYKFKDPSFILEALSHPSYMRNRLTRSYERLEFLGDAILDFLITSYIFENSDDLKPGELTDLRSALVNNVTFASYVVRLGLHKYICSHLNPSLDKAICAFVEHQEQRDHEIVEDVLYLINEEDCHVAEYVEVPKVLSDIFESLCGAIYLDSGGDLQALWTVVYRIMHKEIAAFSARIPRQPVRVLHECIHACPVFHESCVMNTVVPRVMVPVTITKDGRQFKVNGVGSNKFQAKRAAAKIALKVLNLA